MKILYICNKSPWPPIEGGTIGMYNFITKIADAGNEVKVLAANTNKYFVKIDEVPEDFKKKTNFELEYIDLSIKPVDAFLNLFTDKSYHVQRFISKKFEKRLIEILQSETFDIVQIEYLYMSPYLEVVRKYSKAKVVLRAHNIEHLIWKRIADEEKNPVKKFYLRHLATTLENYERGILDKYDAIIPVTAKDAEFFKQNSSVPVVDAPFSIDTEKFSNYINDEPEQALFHIGSMNWMPNEEGIKWFVKEVWPEVSKKHENLKLYLAGREMPKWLVNLNMKNLEVIGEVDDAYEFMSSKSILVSPLFSGSGIRVKIIESMALGKAVISTTIGAEGINYTDGKDILLANNKEEFIEAISKLYTDKLFTRELGKNALELVREQHDIAKVVDKLERFYNMLINT